MAVSAASMAGVFAERLGPDRLIVDPSALSAAAIDGHTPRFIVRPASIDHVAAVLAIAWDESLAVVPRGAGTALGLGAPPSRVDVVLDLTGLDHVLEDNPDDLTVSVEAGMTAGGLAERLAGRRQWLPMDPPGWRRRTLGGMIATNAAGPLRARYGALRDLVLGVRFVQADGVVTWGGARVVKSVTGYDVPKLMVGALGTLGVLCELTLRLHPMPEAEQTWLATFTSVEAAQAFAARVVNSPLQPMRLELLNEAALRVCQAPSAPFGVAVAIGSAHPAVREQGEALAVLASGEKVRVAAVGEDLWTRYDAALTPAEDEVILRIGSLPSRLADTVGVIERAFPAAERAVLITGCASLGSLRVAITGADVETIKQLVEEMRGLTADFGGAVVVESAPTRVRAAFDPWGPVEPAALGLMHAIKQEFDARGVLNPGRFVGGL
jgi:glycolate oxidase FAD binding subunit